MLVRERGLQYLPNGEPTYVVGEGAGGNCPLVNWCETEDSSLLLSTKTHQLTNVGSFFYTD